MNVLFVTHASVFSLWFDKYSQEKTKTALKASLGFHESQKLGTTVYAVTHAQWFCSWTYSGAKSLEKLAHPHTHTHAHRHAHWWKVHGSWIVPQYMSWGDFQEECGLFQKSGQRPKPEVNCCSPRSPVWVWHSSLCSARSVINSRLGFERVEKGCFTLEAQ